MKKFLKIIVIATVIIISIVFIFITSRYGWRLFGFSACDSPNSLYVDAVSVEKGLVNVKGGVGSSMSAYVGYIYNIEDKSIYIGVKHNALFGFVNRVGGFNIRIPVDAANIENVYFKGSSSEKLIWNIDKGLIKNIPKATQSTGGAFED